jgi:hypothetical protein
MTDFTKEQLNWIVRLLLTKDKKIAFSKDYDGRELRPLNSLAEGKFVKSRQARNQKIYTVTKRGMKNIQKMSEC